MTDGARRPAPGEDGTHITFCRLCEALCGLSVEVRDGRIQSVGPDRAHPVSEGHLCVKGARMADIVHDPDRVLYPLKRTGGPGEFERVSWDEALDDIASRLSAIVAEHGGQSVGSYLGNPASFASMHPAYIAGFMNALGGGKKFNSLHTDTAAKNLSMELIYGNPFRYTFPDLESCDFLIIIGGNPAVSHMSLISEPRALQKLDVIAERDGVVVIDPRLTETARRYEHLPVRPDSDVWLLVMMLRTIFDEGLVDETWLGEKTVGGRELRDAIAEVDLARASAECGVALNDAQSLARRFARARTAACYARLGTGRGSFSTLANLLIEALNIVTGRFGQQGGWVIGQSAVDMPRVNAFPYGSKFSRIGNIPVILGTIPGGTMADEITEPGEGQIHAFFMDSGNPVLSYPRGDRLEAALEQLDLLVSLDIYVTETTRWSHYILPSTTFLERPDMNELWGANAPRPWIQYTDAVLAPQGEARNEFDIYSAILARMGLAAPLAMLGTPDNPEPTPVEVADRFLRAGRWGDSAGAEGLSARSLRDDHPHGYRFMDRVDAATTLDFVDWDDGKVRIWGDVQANEFTRLLSQPRAMSHGRDGRLLLFGRRRLQGLNSWMHNSERLVRGYEPALQIHPADAASRGIEDGAQVRVASGVNELVLAAEVTDDVVQGAVCYPHGFGHQGGWQRANGLGGGNVNLLASDDPADWEQVSGICLLDGIPVEVEPLESRPTAAEDTSQAALNVLASK